MTPDFKRMWDHVGRIRRAVKSLPAKNEYITPQSHITKIKSSLDIFDIQMKNTPEVFEQALLKAEQGLTLSKEEGIVYNNLRFSTFKLKNWDEVANSPASIDYGTYTVRGLDLSELDLNSIKLFDAKTNVEIDFHKNEIVYTGEIKININEGGSNVPFCNACEAYNEEILGTPRRRSPNKKASVLSLAGHVIGYIKDRKMGEPSFIASRTVLSPDGKNIFIKGMVYGVELSVLGEVEDKPGSKKREVDGWSVFDLEDILSKLSQKHGDTHQVVRFRAQRFIVESEIFKALDVFTEAFDALGDR